MCPDYVLLAERQTTPGQALRQALDRRAKQALVRFRGTPAHAATVAAAGWRDRRDPHREIQTANAHTCRIAAPRVGARGRRKSGWPRDRDLIPDGKGGYTRQELSAEHGAAPLARVPERFLPPGRSFPRASVPDGAGARKPRGDAHVQR